MNRYSKGFTLMETVVVIGIFTFAMTVITGSIVYFYRSNTYAVEQTSAIQSGRRAVEFFVRDVRETTYAEDGAYPIAALGTSTMTFYADVDGGGDVERVRYFLSAGNLMKGVIKASGNPLGYTGVESLSTVSEYVRNVEKGVDMFEYSDGDGVVVADLSDTQDVRFVEISAIVNVNPNRLPEEFLLSGSAALRNLRDL